MAPATWSEHHGGNDYCTKKLIRLVGTTTNYGDSNMKSILKSTLGLVVLALTGASQAQAADTFPVKPVNIIVAAAPGGLVDIMTRMVAQKMAEHLGEPVVVENRAGASTLVGIKAVKNAPADGYTLLGTSNSITSLPSLRLDPGFDLLKDFTGVGQMVRSPWFMLVGPSQPDKTMAEFVARAKARPEGMSFASGGVGTTPYLAAESFLQQTGLKLLHVPYKGNGAAVPDVMSGRVTMIFDGVGSAAGKVRAGQVRPLGVTSTQRLAAFPDIPTIAEQGVPNFSSYVTIVLFAPAGTPRNVVVRLSDAMQSAVKDLRPRLEADGVEAKSLGPDEFNQSVKRELVEMTKLTADLGLKKQ
jgi:tripartite-type tricarboxylate transporter receptor subunit TctC